MVSPSYPVSSIGTLFSLISNHSPILCLWLLSTPQFYTVHDQGPGSTSLLSFISDVSVFPDPSLLRDCGFDLLRPSWGGCHSAMAGCLPTPRNIWETMLLPMPRDYGWVPARPRKGSRDCVAAEFQSLWKITTHIWYQASPLMSLFQHQRMWLFSRVHWDLCLWGGHTFSTKCPPSREPPLPGWPKDCPDFTLFLGIFPSDRKSVV